MSMIDLEFFTQDFQTRLAIWDKKLQHINNKNIEKASCIFILITSSN